MSEARVRRAFAALAPSAGQVERMAAAIEARVERAPRSIAREWLDVLGARPVVNGAWALAAAVALFVSTPLSVLPAVVRHARTTVAAAPSIGVAAPARARADAGPSRGRAAHGLASVVTDDADDEEPSFPSAFVARTR